MPLISLASAFLTKYLASIVGHSQFTDSAYGFVVTVRKNGMEERYPILLVLGDTIGRNISLDNPPVPIFPTDAPDFAVDKLLAASVLTNAPCYLLLSDADVMHIGFVTPQHVHCEEDDLTFNIFFGIIHTWNSFLRTCECVIQQKHFIRKDNFLQGVIDFV